MSQDVLRFEDKIYKESLKFQGEGRRLALNVHDKLCRAAEFINTPFRLLAEELNGTAKMRRSLNEPATQTNNVIKFPSK